MEILVTDVFMSATGGRVVFDCKCGQGVALWNGSPPAIGERKFVELRMDEKLTIGTNFVKTDEPSGLRAQGRITFIVGNISRIDVEYIRLDFDCGGIDIETTGAQRLVLGQRYQLRTDSLMIFDCDY